MKRNLCMAAFFLIGLNLLGQNLTSAIRGKVIDVSSETPIAFANVIVLNTDPVLGATTDDEGQFVIENVPVGRYDLEVSFIGYESAISNGVLITSGKNQFLTIDLKESIIMMQEVVVRPKKDKEKAINKMATVSTKQLSMEEANKFAGGFDDPARLVTAFAGVASNISSNEIIIRGNAPKGVLWRLEGVAITNPNHFAEVTSFGGGAITALSSRMMANSDFFTGAFPAEYGNGLSGVFDLSIRSGNNEDFEHAFQVGMMGIDFSSEGPLKKGSNSSYLFNYRYSTLGLVDNFLPEGKDLGIAYQDLSYKIKLPTENAGTFELWGLGLIDQQNYAPDQDTVADANKWMYDEDLEQLDGKISMGVTGLTHKYFFDDNTYLKTTLSGSVNRLSVDLDRLDFPSFSLEDDMAITYNERNIQLSTLLNHKFSAKHTNRSGINLINLNYDINLQEAPQLGDPLTSFVDDDGNSFLIQAYSQSSIHLSPKLTLNPGVHFQYFLLNNNYSIEPRLGGVFKLNERSSIGLGYGLHSQIEKLGFYLTEIPTQTGTAQLNKDLDLSKAHHFVLSYDRMLNEHTHLRVEPYVQLLYDIPVIEDSYFSLINLDDDFFINDPLVNEGKGRNIGIDITLERFLNQGWYYLATASVFDAKYQGGDGVWRDSRYNKQFIANLLVGKEWTIKKKNLFNASVRFTYAKGDRLHPTDFEASLAAQDIVEDLSRPFESQKPDSPIMHLTFTYRINKRKHASLWSLQLLNVLGTPENYGYRYNFRKNTIDVDESVVAIPNLSYKIEF